MAKLKMPLGSLGASGQLGKALVFFPWKGLNCVREHVVPANPKSDDQIAQRALMTAAVLEYHGALYSATDMTAWARLAGTIKASMTGFNAMVRAHVKEAILTNTWERIYNVFNVIPGAATLSIDVKKASAGNAPTVRYGTRPTFMPDTQAMGDQGGDVWRGEIAGLAADTLYYFTIDVGASAADFGRLGIYTQRTLAA